MADGMLCYFQAKSKYRWKTPFCDSLILLWTMLLCAAWTQVSANQCGNLKCLHGQCVNTTSSTCVCDPGWVGPQCDTCEGRVSLKGPEGTILDGHGNYTLDTKCSWLIEGRPNATIRLRFTHFATECSWDHLYIYDGKSVFDPLVAALSGLVIPELDGNNKTLPEIVTHSGHVYLHFYSDAAYNMSGFTIAYKMDVCPLDCSGHGTCEANEQCVCESGWRGDGCEFPVCPNDCSEHGGCSSNGCLCQSGWRGIDCNLRDEFGFWEEITYRDGSPVPIGRASHKTVVDGDYVWVVSGEHFGGSPMQDLARYHFKDHQWEFINPKGIQPERRYGHSLVLHGNNLYMYGGLKHNEITKELWKYDITNSEWALVDTGFIITIASPKSNMMAVVGHTAHVINNVMYVIFGHSPVYGYLNAVQECRLDNYQWTLPETTGAIVKGGYGHSSVYDPDTELIYVHAGYHSGSSSSYYLRDTLYSYHPILKEWKILRSSGQKRYLHSAVIIGGLMLVFGGNTHNDTGISQGARCYSADFLAYDMKCGEWYTVGKPHVLRDISRFGHAAEVYDGSMYVFGGFNGVMMNDMYMYTPGKCESHQNDREKCLLARSGTRCVWAHSNGCLTQETAELRKKLKIISAYISPECPETTLDDSQTACPELKHCPSCLATAYKCHWCDSSCWHQECPKDRKEATTVGQCHENFPKASLECSLLHNCLACHSNTGCKWVPRDSKCTEADKVSEDDDKKDLGDPTKTCSEACHSFSTCETCTTAACMWCSNQQRCVQSNSYVASFPYGQCMEWTTQRSKCPATRCNDLRTCEECQMNPACGWCNSESDTGLGTCTDGGADGPINATTSQRENTCPASRWFFTSCPLCQCNGHSSCQHNTDVCLECEDLTTGPQCQYCQDGFYGTATNGGNCSACECNGQADTCNRITGVCYCRTRGIIGDHCDLCDEAHKYYGNPKGGGTCYYDLSTDYQFTFNLSKDDDKYYTEINFMNVPTTPDRDVDFMINCSGKAYMNITVKTRDSQEVILRSNMECHSFKEKFSHKEHKFGGDNNTTFYVYVYDFKTPFWLQISFSQFPQIDLLHFFVTFFSCFLSLLLIAAIFWKVKQRYDLYRRRQQMFVQMEQMASRPFAVCAMEIPPIIEPLATKKEPPDLRGSRRKKTSTKPSPVALEPLQGHKAAVLSLIIRLPCGDEDYTPPGQSGLAIGSSLVTLGNPRKTSVEHTKGDKTKARLVKQNASTNTDNCV